MSKKITVSKQFEFQPIKVSFVIDNLKLYNSLITFVDNSFETVDDLDDDKRTEMYSLLHSIANALVDKK